MEFTRSVLDTERKLSLFLENLDQFSDIGLDTEFSGPLQAHKKNKPVVLVERSNLTGISIAKPDGTSGYIPLDHRKGNLPLVAVSRLEKALCGYPGRVWVHNLKAELASLSRPPRPLYGLLHGLRNGAMLGTALEGRLPVSGTWLCTQVLAWLTETFVLKKQGGKDVRLYNLKDLARQELGLEMSTFKEVTGGRDFDQLTPKEGLDYACEDAEAALLLAEHIMGKDAYSEELWRWYLEVEMPTVWMLRDIQDTGMGIDYDHHRNVTLAEMDAAREALEDEWWFEAPSITLPKGKTKTVTQTVSMNSTKQLAVLFDRWDPKERKGEQGLDPATPKLWAGGQPTQGLGIWPAKGLPLVWAGNWRVPQVNEDTFKHLVEVCPEGSLGHTLARIKLEIQEYSKFTGTYGENLLSIAGQYHDGRLHGGLLQTGTVTGRYSSSYPNLQNIPKRSEEGKRIREAFVASPGRSLVSADYSQVELRVLAHYCKAGLLFDGYVAGQDVHQETADKMGVDRPAAKNGNFAVIYGAGAKRLAATLGVTKVAAEEFLELHQKIHPEVYGTISRMRKAAEERGTARTLGGRTRLVSTSSARAVYDDLRGSGHRWKTSPELRDAWFALGAQERIASNTPVQGSAADICKVGMLRYWRAMNDEAPIVNQVHDDVIVEAPEGREEEVARELQRHLESARETDWWSLRTPLLAEPTWGKRWSDL